MATLTSEAKGCPHTNATIVGDGAFQYCEDCGAVRSRIAGRVNQYAEWHVCDLCRLRGADTNV